MWNLHHWTSREIPTPCKSCLILPFPFLWPSLHSSSLQSQWPNSNFIFSDLLCFTSSLQCIQISSTKWTLHSPLCFTLYSPSSTQNFLSLFHFLSFQQCLSSSTIQYHSFTLFCFLTGSTHPALSPSPLDYKFQESRTLKKISRVYFLEWF